MTSILSTKKYDIFKKYTENRELNRHLIELLKISISKNNMLKYQPIIVNGQMEVIDGQHRLEACREIGETVWYTINKEMTSEDMIELSNNKLTWSYQDYLEYYIKKEKKEYIKLKNLSINFGLPMNYFFQFRKSNRSNSIQSRKEFQDGKLELLSEENISNVIEKYQEFKQLIKDLLIYENKSFVNTKAFFRALTAFLTDPEVDAGEFKNKVVTHINKFRPCASVALYRELFQDIYNYKRKFPIDFKQ